MRLWLVVLKLIAIFCMKETWHKGKHPLLYSDKAVLMNSIVKIRTGYIVLECHSLFFNPYTGEIYLLPITQKRNDRT